MISAIIVACLLEQSVLRDSSFPFFFMCFWHVVFRGDFAVDFYGNGILSDEKQIGPRLEKEIEMYCSNKALEG